MLNQDFDLLLIKQILSGQHHPYILSWVIHTQEDWVDVITTPSPFPPDFSSEHTVKPGNVRVTWQPKLQGSLQQISEQTVG